MEDRRIGILKEKKKLRAETGLGLARVLKLFCCLETKELDFDSDQ